MKKGPHFLPFFCKDSYSSIDLPTQDVHSQPLLQHCTCYYERPSQFLQYDKPPKGYWWLPSDQSTDYTPQFCSFHSY